ncbi:hypothetical protein GQR58_030510 [Nymphon striatum]|nr:hypothetical protein GQR58_030510 [Nymphon striatum]
MPSQGLPPALTMTGAMLLTTRLVDIGSTTRSVGLRREPLERNVHRCWVAQVLESVGKRDLQDLDQQMRAVDRAEAHGSNIEPFEDVEHLDDQRDAAVARRRNADVSPRREPIRVEMAMKTGPPNIMATPTSVNASEAREPVQPLSSSSLVARNARISRYMNPNRFSGGMAAAAITGAGIQISAPPKPEQNMATESTSALGCERAQAQPNQREHEADPHDGKQLVLACRPRHEQRSRRRCLTDPESSRTAGRTTPNANRPNDWATPATPAIRKTAGSPVKRRTGNPHRGRHARQRTPTVVHVPNRWDVTAPRPIAMEAASIESSDLSL